MSIVEINDLRIYQLALELLKETFDLGSKFKPIDWDMTRHIKKTATQIAPAIAEGYAKKSSPKEFKRFLQIAMGSSDEMVTHLRQIKIIGCNDSKVDHLIENYRTLSKQINVLIKVWH